jgi:hypothetical protein
MKEMTLKFFTKLCAMQSNADLFLANGILHYLQTIITTPKDQLMSISLQLLQRVSHPNVSFFYF